jgi:hypothetical protein
VIRMSDRRVCASDEDCRAGEGCVAVVTETVRLCARACPTLYRRCHDGLLCGNVDDPAITSAGAGYCFPGAQAPGSVCRDRYRCGPGQVCSEPGSSLDGACTDLYCEGFEDCPPNHRCDYGGCHPMCDETDVASCPSGYVCNLGTCELESTAALCVRDAVEHVCPIGRICVYDGRLAEGYTCVPPDERSRGCPDGTRLVVSDNAILCIPWRSE